MSPVIIGRVGVGSVVRETLHHRTRSNPGYSHRVTSNDSASWTTIRHGRQTTFPTSEGSRGDGRWDLRSVGVEEPGSSSGEGTRPGESIWDLLDPTPSSLALPSLRTCVGPPW